MSYYDAEKPFPLISVIIPVYNTEKFIGKCIESVLAQTYMNLEIIIINDGSTDNSLNICRKFEGDSRIIIFDNINNGLSYSRQFGYEHSKGDFVCHIDSDDFLGINMIELMYNGISQTCADICVCGRFDYFDNKNKQEFKLVEVNTIIDTNPREVQTKYCQISNQVFASDSWNKLYRRTFLAKTEVKFSLAKESNGTDLLFNHSLIMHCPKYYLIIESLYNHRILNGSRVHRKHKNLQSTFEFITSRLISEAKKTGLYDVSMCNELAKKYYEFLHYSTYDAFCDYNRVEKKIQNLRIAINKHKIFIKGSELFVLCNITRIVSNNSNYKFIKAMNNGKTFYLFMYFYKIQISEIGKRMVKYLLALEDITR